MSNRFKNDRQRKAVMSKYNIPSNTTRTIYPKSKQPKKRFSKVEYDTFEERYFDCPNCQTLISDNGIN